MSEFSERGYALLPGLLDHRHMGALADYLHGLADVPGAFDTDPQVPHSLRRHGQGDPVMNALADRLQPLVERVTNRTLVQTNTFSRIYYTGSALLAHKDRGHCEISCSVTVARDADATWPLWVSNGRETIPLGIEVGDLAIYLGTELAHWRETFPGRRWTQLLLHYVEPGATTESGFLP